MATPKPTSSGSVEVEKSEPLTKDNFVDFESCQTRREINAVERSLDTFLKIHKKEKQKLIQYKTDAKLNECSKNYVCAIIFLRNFKGHYGEDYTSPGLQRTVREEIMGLMASILQAVMNAKQVPESDQGYLKAIYLGEEMCACLQPAKLKNDFHYSFPKLFIAGKTIKHGWYTEESSKEKAVFSSSAIAYKVFEFFAECLVDLYNRDSRASFPGPQHEAAVRRLGQIPPAELSHNLRLVPNSIIFD